MTVRTAGRLGRSVYPGWRPARLNQAVANAALLAVGVLLVVLGQSLLDNAGQAGVRDFGLYALGAAMVVAAAIRPLRAFTGASTLITRGAGERPGPIWLTGTAIAMIAVVISRAWSRGGDQSVTDIVVYWIGSMALLLLAAGWGFWEKRPVLPISLRRVLNWSPAAGILIVTAAFAGRFWDLGRYPTITDSDEGFFALQARMFRDGAIANPFHVFFYTVPQFYLAVEGWVSRPFADAWGSYDLLSAAMGVVAVVATWRVGRRLLGDGIGLMGAAILAFMPLHLWASRITMNNICDCASLSLATLFIDRAITRRSRMGALISGLALGFGMYGYYGSRIFLPLILAMIAAAVALPGRRLPVSDGVRLAGWTLLGYASSAGPIIAHYLAFRADFWARIDAVSGGPPSFAQRGHRTLLAIVWPILNDEMGQGPIGFWRGLNPMLGWAVAPFIVIGAMTWVVWVVNGWMQPRRGSGRPIDLLIIWIAVGVGVGQTETLPSQRFLAVTWVWALAAATGLATIGMAVRHLTNLPVPWMRVLGGATVSAIAIWHAQFYFSEDRQISSYGDYRTMAAYDLAWRFHQLKVSDYPSVLIATPTTFSYSGFGNWVFDAPMLAPLVTNLDPAINLLSDPPAVGPHELLVASAELPQDQICAIATKNPNATVGEGFSRTGSPLYIIFSSAPTLILPAGTPTPGGTVLKQVDSPKCQEQKL